MFATNLSSDFSVKKVGWKHQAREEDGKTSQEIKVLKRRPSHASVDVDDDNEAMQR